MEVFKKQVNIYLFKIIVIVVLMAICGLAGCYFLMDANSRWTPIFAGLTTGLSVGFLQFLLMWTEHTEMEKTKKLGIKDILPHRDNEQFYREVIQRCEKDIWLLGSTAFRFMTDFADESRKDKKALIDALNRNVKVKFLLPEPEYVWKERDKGRASAALEDILKLKSKYGELIECRRYAHPPFHNMLLLDNDCFVGPIFPNRTSKNTPTIYTDVSSIFAESYREYFDYEWEKAKECPQAD